MTLQLFLRNFLASICFLLACSSNLNAQSPLPPAFPDIVCSKLTYSPSHPRVGDTLQISVELVNAGHKVVEAHTSEFRIYLDDRIVLSFDQNERMDALDLAPESKLEFRTARVERFRLAKPGTHRVTLLIDPDNRIPEENKANNLIEVVVEVGE